MTLEGTGDLCSGCEWFGAVGGQRGSLFPVPSHAAELTQTCHRAVHLQLSRCKSAWPIHRSIHRTFAEQPFLLPQRFTLKLIWSHCASELFIVYLLISTRSDSSQLPVIVDPLGQLQRETWLSTPYEWQYSHFPAVTPVLALKDPTLCIEVHVKLTNLC